MNLDDLKAEIEAATAPVVKAEAVEATNGEVVSDEEEFPEDTELEVDLSDAISLLEDCCVLLEELSDPRRRRQITSYMHLELIRTAEEARAFLNQYAVDGQERE